MRARRAGVVAAAMAAVALLASSVAAVWAASATDGLCPNGRAAGTFAGRYAVCAATGDRPAGANRPPGRSAPAPTGQRPATADHGDQTVIPHCTMYSFDPIHGTGPPSGRPAAARPGSAGKWVFQTCENADPGPAGGGYWIWTGPEGGAQEAQVDPGVLAQQAFEQLHPSVPVVDFRPRFHPGSAEATLVGLRTFFWVDRGALQSATKRVAAGAAWAEVTATVQSVAFDPGDGTAAVLCSNGGTPYDPTLPDDRQVAGCWHVYSHPSSGGPFQLRATVTWTATWAGSGRAGGPLPPVTATGAVAVPVQEVQTVNESPASR